jgi:tetratricopeptide (TPR) repeat protein
MKLLRILLVLPALSLQAQEAASSDALLNQHRLAAVLRQATAEYDRGNFQAALTRLDALGAAGDDLSVLNLRAAALTKLGQYGEAGRIFRDIIRANPDYFPAAFNAAEVQFMAGDREGSLETFRGLQQRDPQNELLRFKVFLCQLALGRPEEAGKTAAAMQIAGATPSWYYAQALLARRAGDEGKARKNFKAARALYGDDNCRLFDESVASAGL